MYFLIFLLPLVACVPLQNAAKKYDLGIDNGKLNYVKFLQPSDTALDLSNLGLNDIDKNAFEFVTNAKSLNLSGNSLKSIPLFTFADLDNLEVLSLANNQIESVENLFIGLNKLQLLDISNNPINALRRGHLFGLTKSTEILTEGNVLTTIYTDVFANSLLKDESSTKGGSTNRQTQNQMQVSDRKIREIEMEQENAAFRRVRRDAGDQPRENPRVKLCMTSGTVTLVDKLDDTETLPQDCVEVTYDRSRYELSLRDLGIKSFQDGWYQLRSDQVNSIDLSRNEISEITKEILNGLPQNVKFISFAGNQIKHLRSNVIENPHLKRLNFKANAIETIEDNALNKTNLNGVFLADNQLQNLTFARTLPKTVTELILTSNQIEHIIPGVFSHLKDMYYLNMGHNKIAKLQNNAFQGLDTLPILILTRNRISEIEPRAFSDLKSLTTLYMYQNLISELDRNTFTDLTNLDELNIVTNKISDLSSGAFANLPKSLDSLYLDGNQITNLKRGSFVDAPKSKLSLAQNQISTIDPGAFQLPTLRNLDLNNNSLTTIDGDSFEGLNNIEVLTLSGNKISNIPKGSCKNLASLNILDLSANPFEHARNGALYGLNTDKGNFVHVNNNHLKSIQGGLFEDV